MDPFSTVASGLFGLGTAALKGPAKPGVQQSRADSFAQSATGDFVLGNKGGDVSMLTWLALGMAAWALLKS